MDKLMAWLQSKMFWLPMLGAGKRWQVGTVTVYLWPFVAVGVIVGILLVYHWLFR
jgi:hypothetical protein